MTADAVAVGTIKGKGKDLARAVLRLTALEVNPARRFYERHGFVLTHTISPRPDRAQLGKHEKEIEAEAVAYLVAAKGRDHSYFVTYLKAHASRADLSIVDQDIIIRSAARIERLANIQHGSMEFK
jgi:hypothetical protein